MPIKKRPVKYKGKSYNIPDDKCSKPFWTDVEGQGLFHCWGTEIEEDEKGFHESTVAIVESVSGDVYKIDPNQIKFLDK